MAQHAIVHRFGPDIWVTVVSTGEHVKVELWSNVANAYRVRSAGNGIQFYQDAELQETSPHPDEHFGRHWSRCRRAACGAPLTGDLPICEKCKAPICTCGHCACSLTAARRNKAKKATKKSSKTDEKTPAAEAVEPE